MQKCEKCNSSFSWSKIIKSFKWTYKLIECDKCDTKHKITLFGRFTVVVLTILPMWIFYFLSPFDNIFVTSSASFLLAMIGFLLSPYVARYKEEVCEIHLN